jgi:hypothetical protein
VQSTGEGYQYRAFEVGTIEFPKAQEYEVAIRPAAELGHDMMYLESIQLEPIL